MTKQVDWDKIRAEWESSKITFKDLADKHGVKLGTLKSRRSREKWSREKDATNQQKDATSHQGVATSKGNKSTSNGRKKRGGNPNPKNQFTKRNQAARKHGLFSRYLPDETMEIIEKMEDLNPVDMLWDQILIQYASIIRAQEIMFVGAHDDHDKFVAEDGEYATKYEIHTAWDKQAQFMTSQTRAISELRNLIKQYVAIADEADERRLKLELMQSNIDKTNVEISRLKGDDLTEYESDGFEDAVLGLKDVWADD